MLLPLRCGNLRLLHQQGSPINCLFSVKVRFYPVDRIDGAPSLCIKGNTSLFVHLLAAAGIVEKIVRDKPEFCRALDPAGGLLPARSV